MEGAERAPPLWGPRPTSPWGWCDNTSTEGWAGPVPGFVSEGAGSGEKAAHWPEMMVGLWQHQLPSPVPDQTPGAADGQQALQRGWRVPALGLQAPGEAWLGAAVAGR